MMIMATPRTREVPVGLKNRAVLMLIVFLMMFSPESAGSGPSSVMQVKAVLGSRPPRCVHKCLNCRPCVATLVIPSHPRKQQLKASSPSSSSSSSSPSSSQADDENYYLLSWRCRCGSKLFHP